MGDGLSFSLWSGWLGSGLFLSLGEWVVELRVVGVLFFSLGVGVASRGGCAVVSVSVFLSLSLSIVKVRVVGWWSLFLSGGGGVLTGGWTVVSVSVFLSLSLSIVKIRVGGLCFPSL